MPITNYPFLKTGLSTWPALWIKLTNPANGRAIKTAALIDTGAADCAFPAEVAILLGHDLESVPPIDVQTANRKTYAYAHTSVIEILDVLEDGMASDKVLHTMKNVRIQFTKGLSAFLLGRRTFLDHFVLRIDYPGRKFSVRRPQSRKQKRKKK